MSDELETKQDLYIQLTIGCKIHSLRQDPFRLPYPSLLNSENTNTSQISVEVQQFNVLLEIVI